MNPPSADRTTSPSTVPDVGASDYLRSVLAPVHQSETASVVLTVAIPAGIVHGHAVHPAVWLRRMAAAVRSRPGPEEGKENVARIFDAHAERRDDHGLTQNALMASINHVYLADAVLTSGTATPAPSLPGQGVAPGQGTLWQVALSDISAWTIGAPGPSV
ncbi:hypothetical protein [Pseudonocardia sp. KRD291]|uniref:hypothetical protein n=1 Tax=Pseudonocardia sp. KRD291 TaxID=2792007 RepID=UPI001C49D79C|nr:hypothetical protein [Pseudonocardia sp. KRD291]MBW0105685.1 hypothetical protein [Pseudonocardia sp. KRD291]